MIRKELTDILTAYLIGWKNIRDCAEWLSSIDWNGNVDLESQDLLGRMELLTTEVIEGLRPEADFWTEVAEFVARESDLLFNQPTSGPSLTITNSCNDTINPPIELIVEGVEESPSWSISPVPEPA